MDNKGDSKGKGRRIADSAKAVFIDALCAGARLDDAAAAAGHSLRGFRKLAKREAAFRAGWDAARTAAMAMMAAARSGHGTDAADETVRITSNNQRVFQRRIMVHVRFDTHRQALFLRHFAATCDATAAAAAAGVAESTVLLRRHRDAAFQAAFDDALQEGYAVLSAEALRQRLAAAARLRAAMAGTGEVAALACPDEDLAGEFERTMKLLARWDRKNEPPGIRSIRYGRQKAMSFDEAIHLLDKKLVALGVRRGLLAPEAVEEGMEDGA
jgi:hypothetical protein